MKINYLLLFFTLPFFRFAKNMTTGILTSASKMHINEIADIRQLDDMNSLQKSKYLLVPLTYYSGAYIINFNLHIDNGFSGLNTGRGNDKGGVDLSNTFNLPIAFISSTTAAPISTNFTSSGMERKAFIPNRFMHKHASCYFHLRKLICNLLLPALLTHNYGMITTSEIAPSLALAPFVHSYSYREFDTCGTDVIMPWRASHESNIIFFFKDVPSSLTDTISGKVLKKGKMCDMVGMSTQYNGDMTFNGKYSFLQILFQPHGFYTLFNIPPLEIANRIIWSEDIFDSKIKLLHEQLSDAGSAVEMAKIANAWLMNYLNKKKTINYKDRITITANIITKNSGLVNLDSLAEYACMSMRNFERLFINQTGMSPKQLCCVCRFNNALDLKRDTPSLKWTSIAQLSGYFDQMHLIKDFKRFSGDAPASLIKHVPMLEENYISRVPT